MTSLELNLNLVLALALALVLVLVTRAIILEEVPLLDQKIPRKERIAVDIW